MIVYHGSTMAIKKPEVKFAKKYLDFGRGFYTTTYQQQAEKWAKRKSIRQDKPAIVNVYDFKENIEEFKVLTFKNEDEKWLDFVCGCRRGEPIYEKYDINDLDDLMGYETGDTVRPGLAKSLGVSRKNLDEILNEPKFTELLGKSASEKYRWIIDHNRYILIRKTDWEQVYKNLEESPDSFARYYSLIRVDSGKNDIYKMTSALMINDELYQYTKELAETTKE